MDWWPAIAGTVPGWITAGGVVSLVGIVFTHLRGIQKLKIEAHQVDINSRQIDNADEADIRDHYAEELASLRKALEAAGERAGRRERLFMARERNQEERHRTLMAEGEKRHEECVGAREELRDQARELKDIVAGLIGIIRQASASQAILLGDDASEFVRGAAERVSMMFRPKLPPPAGDKA